MIRKPGNKLNRISGHSLTRREVLVGAAGLTIAAAAVKVGAVQPSAASGSETSPSNGVIRRYMAASAPIGDGRVLVAGGYNRPWKSGRGPRALNSAVLLDPASGVVTEIAPMKVARARHAAVMLVDGRVAVIGGIGLKPTASIELYDPATNSWSSVGQLAQPRYDHTAVYDGYSIHVVGGSGLNMISGVETIHPGGTRWS